LFPDGIFQRQHIDRAPWLTRSKQRNTAGVLSARASRPHVEDGDKIPATRTCFPTLCAFSNSWCRRVFQKVALHTTLSPQTNRLRNSLSDGIFNASSEGEWLGVEKSRVRSSSDLWLKNCCKVFGAKVVLILFSLFWRFELNPWKAISLHVQTTVVQATKDVQLFPEAITKLCCYGHFRYSLDKATHSSWTASSNGSQGSASHPKNASKVFRFNRLWDSNL